MNMQNFAIYAWLAFIAATDFTMSELLCLALYSFMSNVHCSLKMEYQENRKRLKKSIHIAPAQMI